MQNISSVNESMLFQSSSDSPYCGVHCQVKVVYKRDWHMRTAGSEEEIIPVRAKTVLFG